METRRDVREHPREMWRALREESHARAVALAFALVLVAEPLLPEPVTSAAVELATAEAPTAYTKCWLLQTAARGTVTGRE
jgi:hypothetical protein